MPKPKYPFWPKSNRTLVPGQFWAIPLSDGRFAAGRVIEVTAQDRTMFLAGLLDWVGYLLPTADDLAGRSILTQGKAAYLTIINTGSAILGHRPLELDGIEPALMLNQAGWPGAWVQKGFQLLRPASHEEWAALPVCKTWGRLAIRAKAEWVFVQGKPLAETQKTEQEPMD